MQKSTWLNVFESCSNPQSEAVMSVHGEISQKSALK